MTWLIYVGHDENVWFVGDALVHIVKTLWRDWQQHRFTTPVYERPPR